MPKYHKISPKKTKILDPYEGGFAPVDGEVVVDAGKAEYYVAAGEAVYVEKDVPPPWAPNEPAPVTKPSIGGSNEKTEAKTKPETKANL